MPRPATLHRPLIAAVQRHDWAAAEERLRLGDRWLVPEGEESESLRAPPHARVPSGEVFPEHDLLWRTAAVLANGTDTWAFLTRHGAPFYPTMDPVAGRRKLLLECLTYLRLDLADWLVERGIAPERFIAMPFLKSPSNDPQDEALVHATMWDWLLDHTTAISPAADGRSADPFDHLRSCLTQAVEYQPLVATVERLLAAGADASTVCPADAAASPGVALPAPALVTHREGGSALHLLAIAAGQQLRYGGDQNQPEIVSRFGHLWTLLVQAGADPQARNGHGQTAEERAVAASPVLGQFFQSHVRAKAGQIVRPSLVRVARRRT